MDSIKLSIPADGFLEGLSAAVVSECIQRVLQESEAAVAGNEFVVGELMREWVAEAVGKWTKLREASDWRLLVVLVAAFLDVKVGTLLVQKLLHSLASVSIVDRSIHEAINEKEKPKPVAHRTEKPSLRREEPSHRPIEKKDERPRRSRMFDSFDPSAKVPPGMLADLQASAARYARQ